MKKFIVLSLMLLISMIAYCQTEDIPFKTDYYLGISPSAMINRFPAAQISNDLIFNDKFIINTEFAKMLGKPAKDGYRLKLGVQFIIPQNQIPYKIGLNFIHRSTAREYNRNCFGNCNKTILENRVLRGVEITNSIFKNFSSRLRAEVGIGLGYGRLFFDNTEIKNEYGGITFNPFIFFTGKWEDSFDIDETSSTEISYKDYSRIIPVLSFNVNISYRLFTINNP